MTIECTACHARYTIADSLVPPQGARVRCRKCSAVFLVHPPAPLVTPEPLPVVPPAPAPPASPATPAPPPPHAAAPAPPAPAPPPHAAAPPAPVEPPSHGHAPATEPEAAPTSSEPPSRSTAPEAPAQAADSGFDRFPAHAPASHPAPTEFERFPASATSVAPAPPDATAVFAPVPREEMHAAPAPPPALREPVHHEPAAQPVHHGPAPAHQEPAAPIAHHEPAPAHHEPAAPAHHEPAPAHHEPAAPHETHRPRISATTLPEGLSPEELQRHERARRLARVLASDIAIYNREKRERGIRDGNLVAVLGYEIKKSWETYKERVGAEFANSTPYFRDALNEIVAEGKKIF